MSLPPDSWWLMSAFLVARDLTKSYGDRRVFDGLDFLAHRGQPVGLIGENGAGKSTLLRLLAAAEPADSGTVTTPPDLGYLPQEPAFSPGSTMQDVLDNALAPLHEAVTRLEQLASRLDSPPAADDYAATLAWAEHHNAWDAERRAATAAAKLGLDAIDPTRAVNQLSGGERTRLALAALITRQPECVLLDEPSNHLDDTAMDFVEAFLKDLPGVVVVASHDRVFLDRVCAVIVDLDAGHLGVDGLGGNRFSGGFSSYLEIKQAARRRWEQAFQTQQEELNELRRAAQTTARQVAHNRPPRDGDKYIYTFKGANVQATISRRVRNTEQRIAALEADLIPKPPRELSFHQRLTDDASTAAVQLRDVEVAGRLRVPRLDVATGQHLLITGPNGVGKSTLLMLLAGLVTATTGRVHVSARRVGLLPQEVNFHRREDLSVSQVYDEATGSVPPLRELGLIFGQDLNRPVGMLSTGQQRRLALAILVARKPDLLLLDEPTNHISLTLASELEQALQRSLGTVVIASHDRWLRRFWSGAVFGLAS
ncbi:MAG: ABC-F family ATP-binding cassette domain-containing protein [Nocardioidaceae bacterium]